MINLFETLQKAQGGQALEAMGRQFAMSPAQVQIAVDALLPAYTVALQHLARNPQLWPSLIAGMAGYRRHPFARTAPDPPAIWAEGGSRLLDYGGEGPPVLFVPSLVNRAYVLDLVPERSLMRWLPGQGLRTLLLDWGWPGEAERLFTLTDYVAGRLERALAAAPGPVVLAGYCMGGLLALAAALRRPDRVRALALRATPWDFHAGPDGARRARTDAALEPGREAGQPQVGPGAEAVAPVRPGQRALTPPERHVRVSLW
jgi:pimeloyl-ACP methyl ester carboxylesterase